jgi:hypothetical protein
MVKVLKKKANNLTSYKENCFRSINNTRRLGGGGDLPTSLKNDYCSTKTCQINSGICPGY